MRVRQSRDGRLIKIAHSINVIEAVHNGKMLTRGTSRRFSAIRLSATPPKSIGGGASSSSSLSLLAMSLSSCLLSYFGKWLMDGLGTCFRFGVADWLGQSCPSVK